MPALEPACIEVIRPGFLTTVQDLGRTGYQRFGMPVGGAMDPIALCLANRLVGNADGAAALEITVKGPEVLFVSDAIARNFAPSASVCTSTERTPGRSRTMAFHESPPLAEQ